MSIPHLFLCLSIYLCLSTYLSSHHHSHPHTVGYYGSGCTEDNRVFLCIERLHGGTLRDILHDPSRNRLKPPFSTRRVLEMAFQFADALNYLHTGYHPDVTLIHRDLKPDNIGFTDKGMLKLMDFGLCACVRRRQDMDQTYAMTGEWAVILDMISFDVCLWYCMVWYNEMWYETRYYVMSFSIRYDMTFNNICYLCRFKSICITIVTFLVLYCNVLYFYCIVLYISQVIPDLSVTWLLKYCNLYHTMRW